MEPQDSSRFLECTYARVLASDLAPSPQPVGSAGVVAFALVDTVERVN